MPALVILIDICAGLGTIMPAGACIWICACGACISEGNALFVLKWFERPSCLALSSLQRDRWCDTKWPFWVSSFIFRRRCGCGLCVQHKLKYSFRANLDSTNEGLSTKPSTFSNGGQSEKMPGSLCCLPTQTGGGLGNPGGGWATDSPTVKTRRGGKR